MTLQILYVEDADVDYTQFTDMIGEADNADCEVTRAKTADQAIATYKQKPFDLVIVDYRLSSDSQAKSGMHVLDWLIAAGNKIPMICTTDHVDIEIPADSPLHQDHVYFATKQELLRLGGWALIQDVISVPLKVLIVDDDPFDIEVLTMCLEENDVFSFDIRTTTTQDEAALMISEAVPDILIVDYLMGSRSTIEFVWKFARENPTVGIVLNTGHVQIQRDAAANALLEKDIVAFVTKHALSEEFLITAVRNSRHRTKKVDSPTT